MDNESLDFSYLPNELLVWVENIVRKSLCLAFSAPLLDLCVTIYYKKYFVSRLLVTFRTKITFLVLFRKVFLKFRKEKVKMEPYIKAHLSVRLPSSYTSKTVISKQLMFYRLCICVQFMYVIIVMSKRRKLGSKTNVLKHRLIQNMCLCVFVYYNSRLVNLFNRKVKNQLQCCVSDYF